MKKLIVVLLILMTFGCTANQRARQWGGTQNINLPKNQKLVNVTWKNNDLWVLTKPMNQNDVAENYIFQEKSSFGLIQGQINLKETKE